MDAPFEAVAEVEFLTDSELDIVIAFVTQPEFLQFASQRVIAGGGVIRLRVEAAAGIAPELYSGLVRDFFTRAAPSGVAPVASVFASTLEDGPAIPSASAAFVITRSFAICMVLAPLESVAGPSPLYGSYSDSKSEGQGATNRPPHHDFRDSCSVQSPLC